MKKAEDMTSAKRLIAVIAAAGKDKLRDALETMEENT